MVERLNAGGERARKAALLEGPKRAAKAGFKRVE